MKLTDELKALQSSQLGPVQFILFTSALCQSDVKWTRWAVKTRLPGRASHKKTTATWQKYSSSPFAFSLSFTPVFFCFFSFLEIHIKKIFFLFHLRGRCVTNQVSNKKMVGSVSFVVEWWFLCACVKERNYNTDYNFLKRRFRIQAAISHVSEWFWKLDLICAPLLSWLIPSATWHLITFIVYNQCFCSLIVNVFLFCAQAHRGLETELGWRPWCIRVDVCWIFFSLARCTVWRCGSEQDLI